MTVRRIALRFESALRAGTTTPQPGWSAQLVNALRGHAAEFGHVSRLGREGVAKVLADVAEDAEVPTPAKDALALLGCEIGRLDARLVDVDARLVRNTNRPQPARCWRRCRGSGRSAR